MTTQRKVRKEFDTTAEYSVDVSGCSEEEKKRVQQAFFDVGIHWYWDWGGEIYKYLDAAQYTNTASNGCVIPHLMCGSTTEECNMNPDEFFSYVYEPDQQGHIHAELMAMYAEDAKTTDKPWELWQFKDIYGGWTPFYYHPVWETATEYRRKPKTKLINGVEVPDIGIDLSKETKRTDFYTPCTHSNMLFLGLSHHPNYNDRSQLSTLGLTYPYTEEGKQAAILHAKAMLGIV